MNRPDLAYDPNWIREEYRPRFLGSKDTLRTARLFCRDDSDDSREEGMSFLHLPHYMAVELDEPCSAEHGCHTPRHSSHKLQHYPRPKVHCTGDQPTTPRQVYCNYYNSMDSNDKSSMSFRQQQYQKKFENYQEYPLQTSTPIQYYRDRKEKMDQSGMDKTVSQMSFGAGNNTPTLPPRSRLQQYMNYMNSSNIHQRLPSPLKDPFGPLVRKKILYMAKFGGYGEGRGEFTEPSGVCVHPVTDDIIIADTNNHRLQVFDKNGQFKFMFGKCGRWDGQLMYPNRVCFDARSNCFVISERAPTHQVQIYSSEGTFVRRFGSDVLCSPRGLCVDNESRVIVVECKVMRIFIFDIRGALLNMINCANNLIFPNNCCVNNEHEIYITDNGDHCVKVFNYSGQFLRRIGGPGMTNYPIAVSINRANEVVIIDNHNNFNITVYNTDGQLLDAYESRIKHAQCLDAALTSDGRVVMCSKDYRSYIYRYSGPKPVLNEFSSLCHTACSICGPIHECRHVSYTNEIVFPSQPPIQPGLNRAINATNPTSPNNVNLNKPAESLEKNPVIFEVIPPPGKSRPNPYTHTLELRGDAGSIPVDANGFRRFFIEISIPNEC